MIIIHVVLFDIEIIWYIFLAASENPNTPIGCGSRITTPGTEFTSRNHPNNYPNNDQCANLIKFEEGATIRLEFLAFDLEYNGACM